MNGPSQPRQSVITEIQQIIDLVEETSASLRSQRDILKMRGMSLPPAAMQTLTLISNDLKHLLDGVLGEQTELGQLRSLADTSAMINSSLDLDEVLNSSMDVVITLTDAERGYIILRDPNTGEMEYRVTRESELLPLQGDAGTPQISQTILAEVLETGEPLLADNAYKDERLQSGQSIAAMTLRSVLCVPLKYKDQIIGVVYVDNRLRSGVFTEREKNLLSAFANQASVAIENARLYKRIQSSLMEILSIKELMDNVFASVGSGIIATDSRHKVDVYNRAAAHILNRESERAVGQPLNEVLPSISANLDAFLAKVRGKDKAQVMDAEMEVEGRGRVALNIKLSPLKNDQNAIQGVAMVIDDLTETRDREETLNLVKRYLPPELVDQITEISQLGFGGIRREVTCLFVEVRPISSFPADFRPQQIMEQLNIYFAAATEVIHQHKGIVDKYMGTEIMVLFNTQLNPMEDHALRAAETAIAIRATFEDLYKQLGINPQPPYYRIGMNSGVATLGNVGSLNRREFSAIGSTINQSKRMQENAEYGQIIMSQATHKHLMHQMNGQPLTTIRLEDREPIQVKGVKEKIQIYEVFKP